MGTLFKIIRSRKIQLFIWSFAFVVVLSKLPCSLAVFGYCETGVRMLLNGTKIGNLCLRIECVICILAIRINSPWMIKVRDVQISTIWFVLSSHFLRSGMDEQSDFHTPFVWKGNFDARLGRKSSPDEIVMALLKPFWNNSHPNIPWHGPEFIKSCHLVPCVTTLISS
jgi:hypothetical protein